MLMSLRWVVLPALVLAATLAALVVLVAFASAIVYPTLPSLESLTDYQPKIPLRVYSAEGRLIG